MTLPYVLRKGAINEPLFWVLGPQASIYDRLGIVPQRTVRVAEVLEDLRKGSVEGAAE